MKLLEIQAGRSFGEAQGIRQHAEVDLDHRFGHPLTSSVLLYFNANRSDNLPSQIAALEGVINFKSVFPQRSLTSESRRPGNVGRPGFPVIARNLSLTGGKDTIKLPSTSEPFVLCSRRDADESHI